MINDRPAPPLLLAQAPESATALLNSMVNNGVDSTVLSWALVADFRVLAALNADKPLSRRRDGTVE